MLKKILFGFMLLSMFAACSNSAQMANETSDNTTTETTQSGDQSFGEKISADGAMSFDKMLVEMGKKEKIETKVVGTVEGVCQAKGCWMNIVSENDKEKAMFVKFKDYGFFVPKDIAGRKVIMQGEAFREVTSVDELRHYAEDDGKSKEEIAAITEPKEELKFMATGVIVLNDGKK